MMERNGTAQNAQSAGAEDGDERAMAPAGQARAAQARPVSVKGAKKSATAFRTISEVADDLGVQQHVLRFWETKFTQVKPLKRGGGRRYYRPEDVAVLKKIHHLLYSEGYTIKGVQKLMKGQGKQQVIAEGEQKPEKKPANFSVQDDSMPTALPVKAPQKEALSAKQRSILEAMLGDLKELRDMLKGIDEA